MKRGEGWNSDVVVDQNNSSRICDEVFEKCWKSKDTIRVWSSIP